MPAPLIIIIALIVAVVVVEFFGVLLLKFIGIVAIGALLTILGLMFFGD